MSDSEIRKDLPLEYQGYVFLNKEVYFKGGISGFHAIVFFMGLSIITMICLNLFNVVILIIIDTLLVTFMVKKALEISKKNLAGDRDYIASISAWRKTPGEIRDYGLFRELSHEKINI